jgi:5'-3' exonuclease
MCGCDSIPRPRSPSLKLDCFKQSSCKRRSAPLIPDLLALVGDAADGYPGIPGVGARTAAQPLNRYGPIEKFPSNVLGKQRDRALLFKKLATLRTDAPLFTNVETLRWRGPTPAFAAWTERMKAPRLLERCEKAVGR